MHKKHSLGLPNLHKHKGALHYCLQCSWCPLHQVRVRCSTAARAHTLHTRMKCVCAAIQLRMPMRCSTAARVHALQYSCACPCGTHAYKKNHKSGLQTKQLRRMAAQAGGGTVTTHVLPAPSCMPHHGGRHASAQGGTTATRLVGKQAWS